MKGTWVLPSLNRPGLLKEFFTAFKESEGSTPGLVLVHGGDPQKEEYLKLEMPKDWRVVLTGEHITMADKIHSVWEDIKDLDWVGILNDDHKPITKGWDQRVISQITGTNVVSTNDGKTPDKPWNAGSRICGAICFSGKVLRTLGYMFPPDLQHLYSDDAWGFLFSKAQNCNVLMDVCVWHDHAYHNEAKRDETYKKINGIADFTSPEPKGGLWDKDREALKRWFESGQAEKDAQKLIEIQPKMGLMIATPSHDNTCAFGYALGLSDISVHLASHNVYFEMARVVGSSLIPHARNSLVDMFLKSRCQKLLFIDSDEGFTKEAVLHLFQSNKRIVAGVVPHKRFPINLNFEPLPEHAKYFENQANKSSQEFFKYAQECADPKGEIEVNRTGTGFLMIDRSVFDILMPLVEKYEPFDDKVDIYHHEFFKMGSLGKGKFRGEDWHFIEMVKEAKIPIYINANVQVQHQGTFNFSVGM